MVSAPTAAVAPHEVVFQLVVVFFFCFASKSQSCGKFRFLEIGRFLPL